MSEFTESQKERLKELSDKYRKLRARCSQYCATWNSDDRDCEIYGSYHPSVSRCPYFLQMELADEEEVKNYAEGYRKGFVDGIKETERRGSKDT